MLQGAKGWGVMERRPSSIGPSLFTTFLLPPCFSFSFSVHPTDARFHLFSTLNTLILNIPVNFFFCHSRLSQRRIKLGTETRVGSVPSSIFHETDRYFRSLSHVCALALSAEAIPASMGCYLLTGFPVCWLPLLIPHLPQFTFWGIHPYKGKYTHVLFLCFQAPVCEAAFDWFWSEFLKV